VSRGKGQWAAMVSVLATGGSLSDAADAGGVSVSTVQRRLRSPEFRAEIAAAHAEMSRVAVGTLLGQAEVAISRLGEALGADDASQWRWAVDRVLLYSGRYKSLYDHDVRLARLEQAVSEPIDVAGTDDDD
jgi:hypothetical protein